MIYATVCSGIESPSVAWHNLGWEPRFFSEIEPFPCAVLAHHYPDVPCHGDFTTIQEGDYGPVDLICAGTPCQDFSIAGLRKGIDGERGALTIQFVSLLIRLRPRWVVWENVPGILSIDRGWAFASFLDLLGQCGYGFAYRVLDAQHFGVPQRRRRVFVVGCLGDWRPAAAVLFEPESLRGDSPPRREAGQGVARPVASCPEGGSGYRCDADTADSLIAFSAKDHGGDHGEIAPTLRAGTHDKSHANAGVMPAIAYSIRTAHTKGNGFGISEEIQGTLDQAAGSGSAIAFGGNRQSGPVDVATAVNAHGGPHGRLDFESETFVMRSDAPRSGEAKTPSADAEGRIRLRDPGFNVMVDSAPTVDSGAAHIVAHCLRADGFDASEDGTGRGTPLVAFTQNQCGDVLTGDVMHALNTNSNASGRNSAKVQDAMSVRRLTPRECERLQGLPDDYTLIPYRGKPAADGPRYRAIGNSMAVPVMRWIGERIQLIEDLKSGT